MTEDDSRARARATGRRGLGLAVLTTLALSGCGAVAGDATLTAPSVPTAPPSAPPALPRSIVPAGLGVSSGPVAVPLQLRMPTIGASGPVVAVGTTRNGAMDAPMGPIGDPVWQEAFWYRGGGVPGDDGTATIAGHLDDVRGRPALFAHLRDLRPGDPILLDDTEDGSELRFVVSGVTAYSVQQASQLAILATIYGAGPVTGTGPEPAPDGRSHLTLITCAGDFVHGSYDHRVVVYAQRVEQ
jgi:hypothetical protein